MREDIGGSSGRPPVFLWEIPSTFLIYNIRLRSMPGYVSLLSLNSSIL